MGGDYKRGCIGYWGDGNSRDRDRDRRRVYEEGV